MEKACFGAGCFWGVQYLLDQLPGVVKTTVGYEGGKTEKPTYEDICTGSTDHAEVVEVEFDPSKISFLELLNVFFRLHDPTQVNGQGVDLGSQYRSVVFYHNDEQKTLSENYINEFNQRGLYPKPVATEVSAHSTFWPGEEYHQKYLEKNPHRPSCHFLRDY